MGLAMIRDKTPRIKGYRLQQRNRRLFAHNPICVNLIKHHDRRIVKQWDHVVPLFMGGLDHESNLQGLCYECHEFKTLQERGCTQKPTEPQGLDW